MTYAISLHIEDGKPRIVNVAGEPPDGMIEVTGHDDGTNVNIGAMHRDAQGRFVIWASHNRHPEEAARAVG